MQVNLLHLQFVKMQYKVHITCSVMLWIAWFWLSMFPESGLCSLYIVDYIFIYCANQTNVRKLRSFLIIFSRNQSSASSKNEADRSEWILWSIILTERIVKRTDNYLAITRWATIQISNSTGQVGLITSPCTYNGPTLPFTCSPFTIFIAGFQQVSGETGWRLQMVTA